jgi:hypothetical protein
MGAATETLCSVVRKTAARGQLRRLVLALASSGGASQQGGAEDAVNWRKVQRLRPTVVTKGDGRGKERGGRRQARLKMSWRLL